MDTLNLKTRGVLIVQQASVGNIWCQMDTRLGFPGGSDGKESACNAGDRLSPKLGRSPEEGNGYPLQYSCLENPMDRGAWQATVPGAAKSHQIVSSLNMGPWESSFTSQSPSFPIFHWVNNNNTILGLSCGLNVMTNIRFLEQVLWQSSGSDLWSLWKRNPGLESPVTLSAVCRPCSPRLWPSPSSQAQPWQPLLV